MTSKVLGSRSTPYIGGGEEILELDSHDDDDDDQYNNSQQQQLGEGMDVEIIKYSSWDMFDRIWESNAFTYNFGQINMWRMCLQFCYLFPPEYDFIRDDMIQLWMVEGFVSFLDTAILLFKDFQKMDIFLLSYLDHTTGRPRYKLNYSVYNLLQIRHEDEYTRLEDVDSYISDNTLHASLNDTSVNSNTLKHLYQLEKLQTLIIIHEQGSRVHQLPRQLFLNLPLIRVLDLSHTNIIELPSSVGNLEHLRYLNLSGTPITTLPNSICGLCDMRVLKLLGCSKLITLPKSMAKLTKLEQLDVDVACLMVSMPPSLGNLTRLEKLPAFIVGKEKGCHITELKHMENIRGTLCILRLENVYSWAEAKDAALYEKIYIDKLELQWTESQDGFAYKVLENLQPHTELQELQVVGFTSSKFPNWIGDSIFSNLVTITLYDCRNCELLPPFGNLPILKYLFLSNMHVVQTIDSRFCGRNIVSGPLDFGKLVLKTLSRQGDKVFKAFPRLNSFTINGMPMLNKWNGMEKGDFYRLQKLNIRGCSKLTSLPLLSFLISLRQLEISLCPLLESFPSKKLPTLLESVVIIDCPLLKKWYHKEVVNDRGSSTHPSVWIDYQQNSEIFPAGKDEENETDDRIGMLDARENWKQLNKKETHTGNKSKGTFNYNDQEGGLSGGSAGNRWFSSERVEEAILNGQLLPAPNLRVFSFVELKNSTSNFKLDLVLGQGALGKVFKGWIDEKSSKNGSKYLIAVKKLNLDGQQGFEEWQSEVNFLGRLSHPNLVRLLGYCWEDKELLLVYEFMQKGSLDSHLFRDGAAVQPLAWNLRIKILLGAAKGLAFLHSSENQIIYRGFKASNILLDGNYNAKLSDFGSAINGPVGGDSHLTTSVMGTIGYIDPVYIATGHLSVKSDVYGFGVVLLEMLTGLRVIDVNRPSGQHNLVDWLKPSLSNPRMLMRVMDARLHTQYSAKGAIQAAELALKCLSSKPRVRPSMEEVVESLVQIQATNSN